MFHCRFNVHYHYRLGFRTAAYIIYVIVPLTMMANDSLLKTGGRCITQLAKTSADPKLFELAA